MTPIHLDTSCHRVYLLGMVAALRPPVRAGIHTRRVGEAADWMAPEFAPGRLWVTPDATPFELRWERLESAGLRIDRVLHTGVVQGRQLAYPGIRVIEVHRGTVDATVDGRTFTVEPGDALLVAPLAEVDVRAVRVKARTVRVESQALLAHLAEHLGVEQVDIRLVSRASGSPARVQQWSHAVRYLEVGVLALPEVAVAPQSLLDAWRLLTSVLLQTFPQVELGPSIPRQPGPAISAPVRRAIAFMQSQAHRPLTAADIAGAAQLTVRGTEAAFRRQLSTTPLTYLRRIRLARAHHDLTVADPAQGDTVAAVAGRWGFSHLGRFSAQYREIYGVTPRQTLWG